VKILLKWQSKILIATMAQLAAHQTVNLGVFGSSPNGGESILIK
jgi:hypothetical protein